MTGAVGPTRVEQAAIAVLAVLTVAAAAGFAVFGLHPQLIARLPGAATVYPIAFTVAPQLHMGAAAVALAVLLISRARARWVPAFLAVYTLSLGAELLGTTTGVPFGAYAYDRSLAPFWFDHVPVSIPVSWFTVALPAYALALRAEGGPASTILLGAALLTAWDLILDPAMAGATSYWRWAEPGPYYGMPWINLAGWMLTGVALMAALEGLRARAWVRDLPRAALGWIYGLQFLLPMLMAAAAGYWGAIAAASVAVLLLGVASRPPVGTQREAEVAPGPSARSGAGAVA
ncbi:MAG TPA: carotenoid biosynthesis protein [Longimicrobiales bacterium]|nr:carotenoid biosynthesis protein [Longimicrobiales bacterium]